MTSGNERPHTMPPTVHRRVLVATDLSEESESALDLGLRIAQRDGSEIHLCTAIGAPTEPMIFGEDIPADLNLSEQIAECRQALEAAATRNGFKAIPHQIHVFDHLPGNEIPRAARRLDCDLIVICSRRLSRSRRFGLGSAAESILNNATTPVLVVPPRLPKPTSKD